MVVAKGFRPTLVLVCLAWGWIWVRLPQQAASQGHGEHSTHEQPWELRFHYLVGCHWIMGC